MTHAMRFFASIIIFELPSTAAESNCNFPVTGIDTSSSFARRNTRGGALYDTVFCQKHNVIERRGKIRPDPIANNSVY